MHYDYMECYTYYGSDQLSKGAFFKVPLTSKVLVLSYKGIRLVIHITPRKINSTKTSVDTSFIYESNGNRWLSIQPSIVTPRRRRTQGLQITLSNIKLKCIRSISE